MSVSCVASVICGQAPDTEIGNTQRNDMSFSVVHAWLASP